MRKIIISSSFGHEVMAVAIAKSMNLSVVVVPNKDNAEDFHKESENIYTCGSRLICNGCSNCGQCGAGNAAK